MARGDVALKEAWGLAGALFIGAVGIAWSVIGSAGAAGITSVAVGAVLYSPAARRWPLSKNVFAAVLATTPMWLAGIPLGKMPRMIAIVAVACFIVGREILFDLKDGAADERAEMRTAALRLGRGHASLVAWGCMLLGWVALTVHDTQSGGVFGAPHVGLAIGICHLIWCRWERLGVRLSWVPIALSLQPLAARAFG